jgi:hypothetical protein
MNLGGLKVLLCQIARAYDDAKDVVEVVGYAG